MESLCTGCGVEIRIGQRMHILTFPLFPLCEIADILGDRCRAWLSDDEDFPVRIFRAEIFPEFLHLGGFSTSDDAFEDYVQSSEEWKIKSEEYYYPSM